MKEVYIVTKGDYSDYTICQVFDDKELADEFAAQIRGDVEVYDISNELKYAKGLRGYCVFMRKNGDVIRTETIEINDYNKDCVYPAQKPLNLSSIASCTGSFSAAKLLSNTWVNPFELSSYGCFYVYTDMGEKGAIKVANERRSMMIANNKWPYND